MGIRLFLFLFSLMLLSSCMKIDSYITLSSSGTAHSVATIDMSGMVTLLSAFGSGNMNSSLNKDLCKDENFQNGLTEGAFQAKEKIDNLTCTSLGDYKVQIEGDQQMRNIKGVLILSGAFVVDMMALGDTDSTSNNSNITSGEGPTPEELGFSIKQSYILPGKIVYKEAGILSSTNTVILNLLDPKILKRSSLIVISTLDGRKLSRKEINAYKLQLRKHNRKIN